MNEDGINSGGRNIGRFFLALIPWALGIGALVWLSVWIGVHTFRHELSQEDRAAVYTSASERPKGKISIEIKSNGCTKITRADIDGSQLLYYGKNDCHQPIIAFYWHWQELSPDGTVLHEGYENEATCPNPTAGETAECISQINEDDRTATVKVWGSEP